MSTLSDLIESNSEINQSAADWLHLLVSDLQLLSDLSFSDLVLWIPDRTGNFVAVSQFRPSSAATLFYRDFIGEKVRPEWLEKVEAAYNSGKSVESSTPDWYEETPTKVVAIPVAMPEGNSGELKTVAVLTRHSNLGETRSKSRQEATFNECASRLFQMMVQGEFPDMNAPSSPRRGAPRASDGLIWLDADGVVLFASPNGLSAFNRMGYRSELEGQVLAEVTTKVLTGKLIVDESLPLVVTGRAPWRTDVEANGVTVSLRAIPIKQHRERIGAIVLCRDVTELRHQELELLTKDATIREIHHRVKNNLQTVASLLRIQARRSNSDSTREALNQAITRVGAIAVVHDTLSEGLSQNVDFDVVFDRVLMLIAEVASSHNTVVRPKATGKFGVLPSQYATPLALALTELVTNAVEHGLAGRQGTVEIIANRNENTLSVVVKDDGIGLPEGRVGTGLGTQIVRTLIQGELSGSIDWHTLEGEGTEVTIEIPLKWITKKR